MCLRRHYYNVKPLEKWELPVGTPVGTPSGNSQWELPVGTPSGNSQWELPVGTPSGNSQWELPVGNLVVMMEVLLSCTL